MIDITLDVMIPITAIICLTVWALKRHRHNWETIETRNLSRSSEFGGPPSTGLRIIQKCNACGLVQKRDLV